MFRDDAQASRAIHVLLAGQGLASLWSDSGPSAALLQPDGGPLLSTPHRTLIRAALSLWPPLAVGISLADLGRALDGASCRALCALVTACAEGPDAVDAWMASGPGPVLAAAGAPPSIAADWPTLDALSLRYVYRVLEHARNNRTRAAAVLGVDRRTLTRILAVASQGVTPVMQSERRRPRKTPGKQGSLR